MKQNSKHRDAKGLDEFYRKAGFSLVELLVVVAVIGIVASIATPGVMSMVPRYRLKIAARDLYSNLQKARLLAVKENRDISVRFDSVASPGFYYYDIDNDGVWDANEFNVRFSIYGSGVDYGNGNATLNWSGAAIAQAPVLTFSSRGTANSGSVFLDNGNADISYAVTVQTTGGVKIRMYSGIQPFNTTQWK
ncbi:MAG: GspH/FimT family protein [Deltaproteobacteria bacterium]|nr:GspH/FimT family protein [Deltaproteobacteria bacterium]